MQLNQNVRALPSQQWYSTRYSLKMLSTWFCSPTGWCATSSPTCKSLFVRYCNSFFDGLLDEMCVIIKTINALYNSSTCQRFDYIKEYNSGAFITDDHRSMTGEKSHLIGQKSYCSILFDQFDRKIFTWSSRKSLSLMGQNFCMIGQYLSCLISLMRNFVIRPH